MKKPVKGQFRAGRRASWEHQEPKFFHVYVPSSLTPVSIKMAESATLSQAGEEGGRKK